MHGFRIFRFSGNDSAALKFFSASAFVAFLVIAFHPLSAPAPTRRLRVEFLDVGQGDSIFITLPTGETLLVDGGGKPVFNRIYVAREGEEPELFEPDSRSVGESVVSEFLWEKGYSKIDFLIATHADADHIRGVTDAALNFTVEKALIGRTPFEDEDFSEFYAALEKRNVPLEAIGRGDVLNFGGVQISVLNPERDASPDAVSDNNRSLVLRIAYGKKTFLLTGDIEKETENDLAQAPEILRADVVKAAHHGSRTSSTEAFVQASRAKYVVLSAGKHSPYGHPHREVVERWRNSGAELLQTGEHGTISFSTDGEDLRVETFARRE